MKRKTAPHGAGWSLRWQTAHVAPTGSSKHDVTLLTVRHLGTRRKKYSDMPQEDDQVLNTWTLEQQLPWRPDTCASRQWDTNRPRHTGTTAIRITGSNLHFADCLKPSWKQTRCLHQTHPGISINLRFFVICVYKLYIRATETPVVRKSLQKLSSLAPMARSSFETVPCLTSTQETA